MIGKRLLIADDIMKSSFAILIFSIVYIFPSIIFAQTKKTKTTEETSLVTGVKNFDYYGKEDERDGLSLTSSKDKKKEDKNITSVLYYVRDTKSIPLGNRCAEGLWQDYHLRYIIIPKSQRMSEAKFRSHNFKANIRLFFLNGFRWKKKLQKELDDCRRKAGEIVEN